MRASTAATNRTRRRPSPRVKVIEVLRFARSQVRRANPMFRYEVTRYHPVRRRSSGFGLRSGVSAPPGGATPSRQRRSDRASSVVVPRDRRTLEEYGELWDNGYDESPSGGARSGRRETMSMLSSNGPKYAHRLTPTGHVCVWALAVAILALCTVAPSAAFELGHTSVTYSDPARGGRSIPTEIYYPSDTAGDDVPIATAPAGGFPVVALGHGYLITWSDYEYLWEHLSPRGYIVAVPRTETGLFPDHEDLGLDLAFLPGAILADGADPASPLYGGVGTACAVSGHSMGGGASFLGAASSSSISGIFNLAAAETNPSAISAAGSITVPALVFSGSVDCVTPPPDHQIPMYDALASDVKTRVTIGGASHCQFAEQNGLCELGEGGCDDPTISRTEQHDLVLTLLDPWLDHVLKGDVGAWFDFQSLLAGMSGITYEQEGTSSGIEQPVASVLRLERPAPNPFGSESTISFALSEPADVAVRIYNVSGRAVRTLHDRGTEAGRHSVVWDGRDDHGGRVGAGAYFVRVTAGRTSGARSLILIR
ncbi:MAG: T9SS type A sorting domain-containing protein [Candidatus Eisenbacteria bacterium]|nr:T9SS type A sorting domain-containing protein [Candidatus Eisenbacteria bacterium]